MDRVYKKRRSKTHLRTLLAVHYFFVTFDNIEQIRDVFQGKHNPIAQVQLVCMRPDKAVILAKLFKFFLVHQVSLLFRQGRQLKPDLKAVAGLQGLS